MKWRLALKGAIAGAALLIAACGANGPSGYGNAGSSSSGGTTTGAMTTVAVHSTPVGQILVDGNGRTL